MNHDEYVQLVKASEVFQKLDEDFQQEILKAEGEEKDRFIQIFKTERDGIAAAQKEFIENTEQIVDTLEQDLQKEKRDFLKVAESDLRKSEAAGAEELLDSL